MSHKVQLQPLPLKPFQINALQSLRREGHLICVAPTGSGKSLIFQRMAREPDVRMLLITPLVALGRQHQARLTELGVRASFGEQKGDSRVWILSPESLVNPRRIEAIRQWRPNFLAVDECHCVWDWGQDFRPAFGKVPELVRDFDIPRSVWLTATLPKKARIELHARLPGLIREQGEFDLPQNLRIDVRNVTLPARLDLLHSFLRRECVFGRSTGIIFAWTRSSTERLTRLVSAQGLRVWRYHAGLGREERANIELEIERSRHERRPGVVIATSAFGMGMDYTHLEWAVIWQAPLSMLSLTQAIGRVGRADRPGRSVVLWHPDDFRTQEWVAARSDRHRQELTAVWNFLIGSDCRKRAVAAYFDDRPRLRCESFCDSCGPSSLPGRQFVDYEPMGDPRSQLPQEG